MHSSLFARLTSLLALQLGACTSLHSSEPQTFTDLRIQLAAVAAVQAESDHSVPLVVTRVQPWGILGPSCQDELRLVLRRMNENQVMTERQLDELAFDFLSNAVMNYRVDAPVRHVRVSPVIRSGSVALVECSTTGQQVSGVSTLVLLSINEANSDGRPRLLAAPLHNGVSHAHPLVSFSQALLLAPDSRINLQVEGSLEIGPQRQITAARDFTVGVGRSSYSWLGNMGGYGSSRARQKLESINGEFSFERICELYLDGRSRNSFENRLAAIFGGSASIWLVFCDKETRKQIGTLRVHWKLGADNPKLLPRSSASSGQYADF